MKKIQLKTVIVLILILLNTQLVYSNRLFSEKIYSTEIYTLAISDSNRGVVIKVELNVYYPGRGLVIVNEPSRVSEDTVLSIEYSIIYASILCGVDYRLYDYEFTFPENIRIKGLSGTLAFLLSIMSFYRDLKPITKTGVTGIVLPNFMIGFVEKINEKYRAGLDYGLNKIIGPFKNDLLNSTHYYPAVDVFNTFLNYTGFELYNYTTVDLEIYSKHYSVINEVFRESYREWITCIYNLLNNMSKVIDLADYNKTDAYNLLKLSEKYSYLNKWYTASTYAFRTYFETYRYYLGKLLEENKTHIFNSIIEELERDIQYNLDYLNKMLINYSSRVEDLWDLDSYLNSYIRYYISLELYLQVSNQSIVEKARYYPLVISRAITAKTWLKIVDYSIDNKYLIDWKTYRFAVDILKNYLEKTINYIHYLNLINNSEREELLKILNSRDSRDLNTLVNYTLILYDVNTLINLYSPRIFTDNLTYEFISILNKSITSIMKHIYSETGTLIPSITTTIELNNNYLLENTSLSIILSVYSNEYSSLLSILTVIHIDNILESIYVRKPPTSTLEFLKTTNAISSYLVIITILSIGSFLLGLAIGRLYRSVLKEIE